MPHIQQLSPHVADLIAAGEVVERPASVVKELLENAIDAGATAVTVELRDGGMTYLRVSDDGCGIAPEELPTAFLRHATSKLRAAEDLSAIGTLGFRGEALAAISSVSRLDIFTRARGAEHGAALHLEGGVPGAVEEAGCPEGTSVIVRDLFYNTPARLKFMKRDSAEAAAISGLVTHLALSRPDLSFKLVKDGQEALHTPGDGALRSAVYAALGREFTLSLVEVMGRDGALAADGFITRPLNGRGTRGMQTFFVNGRFVKSQLLTAALEEAYANRIMKGKFPGCVLRVTLPFDMVDVNVHPAKTIVKFVSEKQVFDLVYHAVSDALDREAKPVGPAYAAAQAGAAYTAAQALAAHAVGQAGTARAMDQAGAAHADQMSAAHAATAQAARKARGDFYQAMTAEQLRAREAKNSRHGAKRAANAYAPAATDAKAPASAAANAGAPSPAFQTRVPAMTFSELGGKARLSDFVPRGAAASGPPSEASLGPGQTALLPERDAPWRIAGEVLNTYIVCEDAEENVWLIDKHAAHERVNFDRLKAQGAPIASQALLKPLVARLGAAEYAAAAERFPLLRAFGFECEDFGDGAVLLRAVPADIDAADAIGALEELAGKLALVGTADPAAARDSLLATLACKAAIKGGWKSSERELRVLVDRVQSGEIEYCPHGRPVKAKLTKRELEKMFKRIV